MPDRTSVVARAFQRDVGRTGPVVQDPVIRRPVVLWGSRATRLAIGVHALVAVALALSSAVVYSVAFARSVEPVWLVIDVVVIAACGVVAVRHRAKLGTISRRPELAGAIAAVGLAAPLVLFLLVPSMDILSADETGYLRTLREGTLITDGTLPFNLRWLAPMLAGRLNVLPVSDAGALEALNFAGLVVTGTYLGVLMLRLGARPLLAIATPLFLMSSYLGQYAAWNRLVIDPVNYAMYVLLFHALLRREHRGVFAVLLLVAAFNSEKAIYWIPVFAVAELLRDSAPWSRAALGEVIVRTAKVAAPTLVYGAGIAVVLHGATYADEPSLLQNVHVMGFSWIPVKLTERAAQKINFQMLWFPFGALTIYALLALRHAPAAARAVALLLVPVLGQTLVAHDTQRMISYAFIVCIPLGILYLSQLLDELPRALGAAFVASTLVLLIGQGAVRILEVPGLVDNLVVTVFELALVLSIVFVHQGVIAPARPRGAEP